MGGDLDDRWGHMLTHWHFFAAYLRARFGRDERGASLVEYALLVALIAVVCIVAIGFVGTRASEKFSGVASNLAD